MIPVLKPLGWESIESGVRIVLDPRESIELADEDGSIAALLTLLTEGRHDAAGLYHALNPAFPAVSREDVLDAIGALDELRLIEDRDRTGDLTEDERLRHFSNLAFLRTFSTLEASAETMVRRLRDSHVLMLGVGGLGSNVLQNLCGLGVGQLTLVDRDDVEPRNFARQFVYRAQDIGRPKIERAADWVREFDPQIKVRTIRADFTDAASVAEVVDSTRPDAVCAGVDSPAEIDQWVNAACVRAGVPFVRGGMMVTEGVIWSVQPGQSACLACPTDSDDSSGRVANSLLHQQGVARINRGAGPVATLLGSLVSFELLRYLTGFTAPRYAGASVVIDLAGDCDLTITARSRRPDCPVCGSELPAPEPEAVAAAGG
ncbi:MAG TPA: ThiF family adenylyltransferase [Jatrophihabitans sp.]|jgi:molybdopterin/thiamine biosynthesis adenylyltransferase|uniref:HesA/MoeB/ThiF family protein n=1 Tax=Jatrophihabitans sp. TaxID=1932789 RepID=UPI002EDEFD0D